MKPLKKNATYDDLREVPDRFVAEMFDGDLYAFPRPALPHSRAASVLGAALMGPFDQGRNGPGGWLFYLVCAACLSFSAFFEFIEWWVALIMGGDADAYLATQGDIWDTHWDMFLALVGAILAQLMLARVHDRQLGVPR